MVFAPWYKYNSTYSICGTCTSRWAEDAKACSDALVMRRHIRPCMNRGVIGRTPSQTIESGLHAGMTKCISSCPSEAWPNNAAQQLEERPVDWKQLPIRIGKRWNNCSVNFREATHVT